MYKRQIFIFSALGALATASASLAAAVDTSAIDLHERGDGQGMPLRDDGEAQLPLAHGRETFAPASRDGFFLVPRLATHEDASEDA